MSRTVGFILSVAFAVRGTFCGRDVHCSAAVRRTTARREAVPGLSDIRRIDISAKDAKGWQETIRVMIQDGAEVERIPLMVQYLARDRGGVPEGPGRPILLNTCTMCHNLGRIKNGRRSPEKWEETLLAMLNEGARVSTSGCRIPPTCHAASASTSSSRPCASRSPG